MIINKVMKHFMKCAVGSYSQCPIQHTGRSEDQVTRLAKVMWVNKKSNLSWIFYKMGVRSGPHCFEDKPFCNREGTTPSKRRQSLESRVRWMIVMPGKMLLPRIHGMTRVKGHKCFISGRAGEQ